MPIDPCTEGCQNHNIGADALPTAGDDPCNTAGNGFYCPGSYWLTNPGVGECGEQLFLRTGADCNVYQWIEIALATLITDTVDPVDGTDCCPPGSLWRNTTTGELFISHNNGGDCLWCNICEESHTSVEDSAVTAEITYQDIGGTPIPPGSTPGLVPAAAAIINPSLTRDMAVQVVFQGYNADFSFQDTAGPMDFSYSVRPTFRINGVVQNNPFGTDTIITRIGCSGTSFETDKATSSWTYTTVIGPGGNLTADMFATLDEAIPHNVDISARIVIGSGSVSIIGTTV